MKKLLFYTLIAFGLNIVSIFLFCLPIFFSMNIDPIGSVILAFALTGLSLVIQAIVALIFLTDEKRKEVGQAMLLCLGIYLLIGISICSGH